LHSIKANEVIPLFELEIDGPRDPRKKERKKENFLLLIHPFFSMATKLAIPTTTKAWVYREHGDVTSVESGPGVRGP